MPFARRSTEHPYPRPCAQNAEAKAATAPTRYAHVPLQRRQPVLRVGRRSSRPSPHRDHSAWRWGIPGCSSTSPSSPRVTCPCVGDGLPVFDPKLPAHFDGILVGAHVEELPAVIVGLLFHRGFDVGTSPFSAGVFQPVPSGCDSGRSRSSTGAGPGGRCWPAPPIGTNIGAGAGNRAESSANQHFLSVTQPITRAAAQLRKVFRLKMIAGEVPQPGDSALPGRRR